MALLSLLRPKTSSYTSSSLSSFALCPWRAVTSSFFSSRCRVHPLTPSIEVPPPTPKKVPFTVSVHGNTWQDPYHWMSNTEDPDFLEYLNRENSYAEAFMADTHKFQSKLSSEMKRRIPTTVSTPPERWGPWLYYQYIPEGKEYHVLCRRLATERNGWLKNFLHQAVTRSKMEEVLLDWNELAEQYGKFPLRFIVIYKLTIDIFSF